MLSLLVGAEQILLLVVFLEQIDSMINFEKTNFQDLTDNIVYSQKRTYSKTDLLSRPIIRLTVYKCRFDFCPIIQDSNVFTSFLKIK